MKIYIAGPMTGIPQFNIPAFDAAADRLRSYGYDVVSPAELDDQAVRTAALMSPTGTDPATNGQTWGDFLARDVKLIADEGITHIALLTDWYKSRGATLEATVGLLNNLQFLVYGGSEIAVLSPVSDAFVLDMIHEGFRYRWRKSA